VRCSQSQAATLLRNLPSDARGRLEGGGGVTGGGGGTGDGEVASGRRRGVGGQRAKRERGATREPRVPSASSECEEVLRGGDGAVGADGGTGSVDLASGR